MIMTKYAFLLLLNVLIGSVSQVMLKKSANSPHKNALSEYLNVWVISAYALFGLTTLIGILAYQKLPLSLGQAIESSSYVFIMVFDTVLFHEAVNTKKVLSVLLIILGIIICSVST